MDYRCIGCGAVIQSMEEDKPGYVKASLLVEKRESIYCKRCFSLMNYGREENVIVSKDQYLKTVTEIGKEDALIVNVVDLFDFSGTFFNSIKRITGNDDVILVGNKRDLLPKSVKDYKIVRWMRHMANFDDVKVLDAICLSAKKILGIDLLMDMIDKYRQKRNVYIVGMANVGKSTLVNAIIKKYTDAKKDVITTSGIPGTTLDFIKIPYNDAFIIDTPGIINDKQASYYLDKKSLELITPTKEIKPIVYQLNAAQVVFISGLAKMEYLKGDKTTFVFYFSDKIKIHRTKKENEERITSQIGVFLVPPFTNDIHFDSKEFVIKDDGKKYDIVIAGLGFITVKGNVRIKMSCKKGLGLYFRDSVI